VLGSRFNEAAANSPRKQGQGPCAHQYATGFNEAAANSPRKLPQPANAAGRIVGFNEAAANSPRKRDQRADREADDPASMRPRRIRRGNSVRRFSP